MRHPEAAEWDDQWPTWAAAEAESDDQWPTWAAAEAEPGDQQAAGPRAEAHRPLRAAERPAVPSAASEDAGQDAASRPTVNDC